MSTSPKKKLQSKKNIPQSPQGLTVLTGLAQELDSPLRSVTQRTENLINEYKAKNFEYISFKDYKTIFNTLEQINRQLKHFCTITGRMIETHKRKAHLEKDSSQVNEVVKEVLALTKQQLETARIKIQLRLSPDVPLVHLGAVECHQVINNVLANAVQSMPGGGLIKIATKYQASKQMVAVDICDEGIGITPEHLSRIYEPFFTTKEHGIEKSSGLGLSIVHFIVSNTGGVIDIKSSLRNGTHVHIELPAVPIQS
jgi:signal transduction histidine kinase